MGFAVFDQQPTSIAIRTFLSRVLTQAGASPRYLITDQGEQFRDKGFRRWCLRRGIEVRGRRGQRLELNVRYVSRRKHRPIVALRPAA